MYRYIICCKNSITEEQLDLIIKDYENNSVLYIEQTYNISFRSFVKNLGLKHKNISDSRKTNSCKERTKNTNNQKYGVDNISQSEHIKQKKKETFLKNYGVDNIWKLKEYRIEWEQKMIEKYGSPYIGNIHGNGNLWGWNNLESKISRINKLKEDFKKWYYNLSEEDKEIYAKTRGNYLVKASKSFLETRIEKILIDNCIFNKSQYWIKRKSYDFWLGEKNILEIQGKYWHCDPRFYKENDIIQHGESYYLVKDVWDKDEEKKKLAEKYGYNVFYLWETDIKNMTDFDILNKIKNFINENKKNQQARN